MNSRYSSGTTISVSSVENASPHTMAVATGPQISDLPPSPVASENSPAMVVSEVIKIGITRRRAAYGHHGGWKTEGLGDDVGQTWGKTVTGGEWRYELHPHRWQGEILRKLRGILSWPLPRDVQPAIRCKTTQ